MNARYLAVFIAVALLAAGLVATDLPDAGFRAVGPSNDTPLSRGPGPTDGGVGVELAFSCPLSRTSIAIEHRHGACGVLAVRREADFTSDVVDLVAGQELALGGHELVIVGRAPSQWGTGHALTVESTRDLAAIVAWALVLEDGSELPLRPTLSTSSMGTFQQTLELEEPVSRAALRITSWTDLTTIEVPFEVEAGLGLR